MSYWDSSALAPLFLGQRATAPMRRLHRADRDVHTWWGSRIECVSAVSRLAREGRLEAAGETRARADLNDLFGAVAEIAPTDDVRARAERALAVHPLRAADALQLAAALVWARDRPAGLAFVSLDVRLRHAAAREGFSLLPPDGEL